MDRDITVMEAIMVINQCPEPVSRVTVMQRIDPQTEALTEPRSFSSRSFTTERPRPELFVLRDESPV